MNKTAQYLHFAALLVALCGAAYVINYAYLSDQELTVFGDRIRFWHEDTLSGPVRSNYQIAIMENPVFYDIVIQAGSWTDFEHGSGYNPCFLGPPPVFRARPIWIPDQAYHLHENATQIFAPGAGQQMKIEIDSNFARLYTWPIGIGFNGADPVVDSMLLNSTEILFFECPLRVEARVAGDITLASTHSIGLDDNATCVDADSVTGRMPEESENFLTLVAEGEIIVRNTPENGRNNSDGLGHDQTDLDLRDIVITANVFALGGSFTFDQQNDPDSGYQGPSPDERGIIWLYGGLTQHRRGYVHRSNHGGTGYAKVYRYDERLRARLNPVLGPFGNEPPDTLYFGDVAVGEILWDTLELHPELPGTLGAVLASYPFWAERIEPFFGSDFVIPVRFAPPSVGPHTGMLTIVTTYQTFQIVLRGTGIPGSAPPIAEPSVYPNPFNNNAAISFTIPVAGHVSLELYDILGRRALTVFDDDVLPGSQSLRIDAQTLASGIYFAHLRTPSQQKTMKLLLVK